MSFSINRSFIRPSTEGSSKNSIILSGTPSTLLRSSATYAAQTSLKSAISQMSKMLKGFSSFLAPPSLIMATSCAFSLSSSSCIPSLFFRICLIKSLCTLSRSLLLIIPASASLNTFCTAIKRAHASTISSSSSSKSKNRFISSL